MGENREKTRYVLVVRLPRRVEIRIEDVFLNLVGATKPTMGYHITLAGPFSLPDGMNTRCLSSIAEVCRRREPFQVRIAGLDAFRAKDSNAGYVRVRVPEPLVSLHNELLKTLERRITLQDGQDSAQYVPHVTLGLGLNDKQIETFLRVGPDRVFDESFEVSHIWLVEQPPDSPWRFVSNCPLGNLPQDSAPSLEPDVRQDTLY